VKFTVGRAGAAGPAGQLQFLATVTARDEVPSPHTGAPLRTLVVQFRAPKLAMHEQALEAVRSRQPVYSLGEDGEPDGEWRIREGGFTYIGSEPWGVHHHTWRLEEVERVACRLLRLAELELEPYEYAEQAADDGRLTLAARCVASAEALHAVRELRFDGLAIDVVRVGISHEPRSMRLDEYVWGPCVRGELGVALRCQDVRPPRVALGGASVDGEPAALFAFLHERGVLDVTDIEQLRQRRHALRHVPDLDAWPLQAPAINR
jgi:hypothetical protein